MGWRTKDLRIKILLGAVGGKKFEFKRHKKSVNTAYIIYNITALKKSLQQPTIQSALCYFITVIQLKNNQLVTGLSRFD